MYMYFEFFLKLAMEAKRTVDSFETNNPNIVRFYFYFLIPLALKKIKNYANLKF